MQMDTGVMSLNNFKQLLEQMPTGSANVCWVLWTINHIALGQDAWHDAADAASPRNNTTAVAFSIPPTSSLPLTMVGSDVFGVHQGVQQEQAVPSAGGGSGGGSGGGGGGSALEVDVPITAIRQILQVRSTEWISTTASSHKFI
jgi:hypothetical protein